MEAVKCKQCIKLRPAAMVMYPPSSSKGETVQMSASDHRWPINSGREWKTRDQDRLSTRWPRISVKYNLIYLSLGMSKLNWLTNLNRSKWSKETVRALSMQVWNSIQQRRLLSFQKWNALSVEMRRNGLSHQKERCHNLNCLLNLKFLLKSRKSKLCQVQY